MAETPTRPTYIGARIPRVEDDRLLAGQARYLADIRRPGTVEVALIRSPLAHARIERIQTDAASAAPGVLRVVTASDLAGVSPVPDFFDWARPVRTFPLCRDVVRYVGAPVAAVVADDRYLAEDAAELVEVDYESLPVVESIDGALAEGAPTLFADWPDNVMVDAPGTDEQVKGVFACAHRVVSGRYVTQRYSAVPMETRGTLARWEDGRLTVWTTTQFPHICRTLLAHVLSVPESDIRVVAPDIGGGFGCKAEIYPEDFLVCWLARDLGRPVRYIEDRAEHMVATGQARDMVIDVAAAVDADGRVEAVRGTVDQDLGSEELYPPGFCMAFVAMGSLTGPYHIPHQNVRVRGIVTNKTPAGAYRGFGIPEAVFAMERLMDKIATETGISRIEVRRRNLITPGDLPYATAAGSVLDSGSHRAAFERVIEMGQAALAEVKASHGDRANTRLGLGVINYVEGVNPTYFNTTGNWTANEACTLRVEPDGTVTVAGGVLTMGQGVNTMAATLAAESLGMPIERIRVAFGDTDTNPYGLGAWGSRSTGAFGGALVKAAAQIREKAAAIAAHLLEAAPADMVFAAGRIHVAGSEEYGVTWADVARTATVRTLDLPPGMDPGLDATATYQPANLDHVPRPDGRMNASATYTNASHAAVVAVDIETGVVEVLRYLVTHDCGTVINPTIVDGQIHGGVAQGIGGALYEHNVYGPEGTPLATTFMDYLLPTATEIPPIVVEHFESPAPGSAFGAKGAGEAGLIGPAPAIAAAVEDALCEFGVTDLSETPLRPSAVMSAIRRRHGPEHA
jgi:aerobic carbon-monoxide dehydrogenase large subunit